MKIRYFSDLHLEFIKEKDIELFLINIHNNNDDDICICAGDIGYPFESNYDKFMIHLSKIFKQSFVITGNHEYYNKDKTISEINDYLHKYFDKFSNITFLNNSFVLYENFYFIGTTLWSFISDYSKIINDTNYIKHHDCDKHNENNRISVQFLENTLQHLPNNCIIITHHLPSYLLVDQKFKNSFFEPYNQWYYSNLDSLINLHKDKIICWIYGHTHIQSYTTINNIPFICNPIGYPNENDTKDFNKNIIIS